MDNSKSTTFKWHDNHVSQPHVPKTLVSCSKEVLNRQALPLAAIAPDSLSLATQRNTRVKPQSRQDRLWVARFNGGCCGCYDPKSGQLLGEVHVPAEAGRQASGSRGGEATLLGVVSALPPARQARLFLRTQMYVVWSEILRLLQYVDVLFDCFLLWSDCLKDLSGDISGLWW